MNRMRFICPLHFLFYEIYCDTLPLADVYTVDSSLYDHIAIIFLAKVLFMH